MADDPRPLIALHINDLSAGGAEKMRLVIARELLRRGYRVDLVLCRARGEYLPQVPEGARVVDLNAASAPKSLLPLAAYLRKNRPAVMISSLGYHNTMAVSANWLAGRPSRVFVTQHNNLSSQSDQARNLRLVPLLYKAILPMADGVIAVSAGIADDMARTVGFPRAKITVLYNPAAPDDAAAQGSEAIDDPFFNTGEPILVSVGRLHPQKAFDTLISAFALLSAKRPARLAICGVGPLEGELKAQAEALGVGDRVRFTGFQANPLKFMARADAMVMASRFEGFGNAIVEALACGTPVVSTDCPHGPAEILDHGRFGLLTPVDDAEALADAMARTLDSPIPSETLIERSRDFSPARVVDRYLALIKPGVPAQAPS